MLNELLENCKSKHHKHPPSPALKSVEEKIVQLGTLAGKLGGFVGESESVKKAVIYAIIAVINSNEELKNDYSSHVTNLSVSVNSAGKAGDTAVISELKSQVTSQITEINMQLNKPNNLNYNSPSSPSSSAELAKLQSKLEALRKVKELCGFLTNLNNQQNEPKNLLTNLCDGLETFLGFDSDSKGYTGQGIVYSDLDRLCDGVMGFLSGVLEDVSEKQPYSVGKTILIEIVTELKNNLSTGRQGFSVIERVAQRVREYNERVKESNKKVKDPITTLKDKMEQLKITVSAILNDHSVAGDPAKVDDAKLTILTNVKNCIKYAKIFNGKLNTHNTNIRDLNPELSSKITNAKTSIKYQRDVLEKRSDEQWKLLSTMVAQISDTLETLKQSVKDKIKYEVSVLVDRLKFKVENIKEKLEYIFQALQHYVKKLDIWLINAKAAVSAESHRVGEILEEVKWDEKGHKGEKRKAVEAAAKNLRGRAEALHQVGNEAITKVVRDAEEALNDLKLMDGKLKLNLNTVKNQIGQLISDYFKGYATLVKKKVETIRGNADGGLTQIVQETKNYSSHYKNFNNIVHSWLDGILGHNGVVQEKLGEFVTRNIKEGKLMGTEISRILNGGDETLYSAIKKAIKNALDGEVITPASQKVQGVIGSIQRDSSNELENYVTAVIEGCKQFAELLESKLTFGQMEEFVQKLLDEIEGDLQVPKSSTTGHYDLELSISATLVSLAASARQVSEQLETFIGDNNSKLDITTMEAALRSTTDLHTGIDRSLKLANDAAPTYTPGTKTNLDQYNIDKDIAAKLEERLPEAGDGKVAIDPKYFYDYDSHVNQRGVTAALLNGGTLKGKAEEGTLPKKIGDIARGITEALQPIDGLNAEAETQLQLVHQRLEQLCGSIRQSGELTKHYLNDFMDNNIGGTKDTELIGIKSRISKLLSKQITDGITFASAFLNSDAPLFETECIQVLQDYVSSQISSATSTLTTLARKQYVTSIKALLTAFADKVTEELSPLPGEIDADLRIGFKGLMKTLEDGSTHKDAKQQENIKLLSNLTDKSASSGSKPMTFTELAQSFYEFLIPLDTYIQKEIKNVHNEENEKKNPNPSNTETLYTGKFNAVVKGFESLLFHLIERKKYDCNVPNKLQNLIDTLTDLKPENFATPNSPVLDGVIEGLTKFADELDKAYISVYDSQICGELIKDYKQVSNLTGVVETYDLTDEGRNCAKVFLSILETLFHDLHVLRINCIPKSSQWHSKDVCLYDVEEDGSRVENRLGGWLRGRGFRVSQTKASHDGELRIQPHSTKNGIHGFMVNGSNDKYLFKNNDHKEQSRAVQKLIHHLHDYWKVCHLYIPHNPKTPSNINQMLQWLAGLRFRPDLNPLYMCFKESFPKPEGMEHLSYKEIKREDVKLSATTTITYQEMAAITLRDVCLQSYDILLAIQGHGHASGRYAVDFRTNVDNLDYPSNAASCFDMLVDVSYRVYDQLYFVFIQCQRTSEANSWRECWYGRHIGGSSWECNSMQCPNQRCPQKVDQIANQNANQNANQIARQTCDQHPKCGIKSPLQSFLEDGLQGFLPHSLTKIGCGEECSLGKHRGLPCKTPMGYAALGVEASHTKKGENLADILEGFCGKRNSSLTLLCAQFTCLLQKAPQSLDDMFSFFYNFLKDRTTNSEHRLAAFENAVRKANFGDATKRLDITCMFSDKSHGTNGTSTHIKGDLYCLYSCDYDSEPEITCGRYLQSCGINIWSTFSSKNSGRYLSWIVYLTETFYDLLKHFTRSAAIIATSRAPDATARFAPKNAKCKCITNRKHPILRLKRPLPSRILITISNANLSRRVHSLVQHCRSMASFFKAHTTSVVHTMWHPKGRAKICAKP
ncbi:hypothetical protein, conserved [Babesia bigemina]|uniref:Extracellular matrix-binding ebh n=1 Tax=Babesia bigemina TaxID=5866 RepID=A0A061BK74_BABBI|nr:hypothetical protein, conserved [Babesia bigemina]CDR71880.1 hypothetical protein, conserved [Babesia bigemina]|eukprot:XP_012770823.1 hypothetical protein, conserved [Babesia bigemina]